MGTGKRRQTNGLDVLVNGGGDNLFRSLMKAGIDDFIAGVAQGPGDHLGAPIVSVETGFGDQYPSWHEP